MIRIDSNTDTLEELKEQLKGIGDVEIGQTDTEAASAGTKTPAGEPSEKPGESGDKSAAATGDEPKAGTEPVKSQEPPAGETEEEKTKRLEKTSKGGFQRQIEKKTAQIDSLKDQLDEERGDKTRLRDQLAQLKGQLEELKGGAPASTEEPKDKGPARPKRPDMPELSEFDFDAEKFSAAMKDYRKSAAKYDDDLDVYFQAVAEQKADQKVAADNERRATEGRNAEAVKLENAFVGRREEGKALIEDYDDVMGTIPSTDVTFFDRDIPAEGMLSVAAHYVKFESDAPAELLYYFAKDHSENDGAEGERLLALSPTKRVIELRKIEERLVQERAALNAPPAKREEPKPATPPAARETPAPPKPARKAPDDPIDPVGAHGVSGSPGDLHQQLDKASQAGDAREVRRIRELIRKASAANGRA